MAKKIDLTTADLGRHIKNGEIILREGLNSQVLYTNYYSYTQPDFKFINHHWAGGVIFYLLELWGGFELTSVFYIALGVLTLLIIFDASRRMANFWVALGVSSALLPLMMSRTEVRPEMATYFFSAIFFWVLNRQMNTDFKTDKHGYRLLWMLPIITLLWVNIHIGWFFGPLLIILFLAGELWESRQIFNQRIKFYVILLALCGVVSLINPNGLWGALYPLNVFKNYGYLVVENQSIRFLESLKHTAGLHFTLIKTVMAVAGIGIIAAFIKLRTKVNITLILLGVITGIMSWFGIRNFPFFGFFALPVLGYLIKIWLPEEKGNPLTQRVTLSIAIPVAIFLFVISLSQTYQAIQARGPAFGIGLLPGANDSAEFYNQNKIAAPLFNNYDIGSYLIYHLKDQKVFVDNRPEAYKADFLQGVYVKAQEEGEAWRKLDEKHNFNSIFFSHRDFTPWGQAFLIARVQDSAWAPVYVDGYNIIFLKRNVQNNALIKKYELPKSMFSVK